MAYSKSSPNNKFAPSTVVSMASRTSNRPMSYGQVYENLNYEMGMHKISDTDRKWMACRKNFINNNKRAFEELQIKVGNLIEAGKIPPNYANNLDKICTEDEFNSINLNDLLVNFLNKQSKIIGFESLLKFYLSDFLIENLEDSFVDVFVNFTLEKINEFKIEKFSELIGIISSIYY